jgi:DNA-binding SARP family transcriptional activator/TolB-like protein/Tfp pilus assembly protein PilF
MLTLRLLGNATLQDEQSNLSGRAVQPRRLALLALLALSPRKALSRDKLLAYLWPESDTEQGRHLLSVAVYELRKALGEGTLVTARDDVSLNPGAIDIDVDQFEAAISAGDYDRAIALYRGPLLDGFHINDAPDFERWVDGERTLLARRFSEALEKAAHQRESAGDFAGAVSMWRQLAVHEPYSARIACGLMSALESAGDRAGALQHARTHAALLREEFGAEPDPDVEALAARLKREPREASIHKPVHSGSETAPALTPQSASRPRSRKIPAIALVSVLAIAAVIIWGLNPPPLPPPPEPPRIGVLPFKTSAADSFFSAGLSEEIINMLSREATLRVISAYSTQPEQLDDDMRTAAEQLDADYLVEGAVRRAGDRLKVNARLINVGEGLEVVWAGDYEGAREMADAISIQEEIALGVVREVAQRLNQTVTSKPLVVAPTNDVEAFELLSAGRRFYHRRTVPDMQRALEYFEKAIARDPNYALAHASKAEVYTLLGAYDYGALPPRMAFTAAREAAERALAINPKLAEAHNALASVLFNYDWNPEEAERAYRRAIELSPGYANAYHWYSLLLHTDGRPKEAIASVMRAKEMDPLSSVISAALARHYYFARQTDKAIAEYRATLATDSQFVTAHVGLGLGYAAKGQYDQAIKEYETVSRLLGMRTPLMMALTANAHGRAGRIGEARKHLEQLSAVAQRRYVPAEYLAVAYIGVADHDAAFAAFDQAVANRSAGVIYLEIEPLVDPLRRDPRLAALLERIKKAKL